MSPIKFFRKNSRTLILVIMSALLVVFLLEPALNRYGRMSGEHAVVVGEAFGRKLTLGEVNRSIGELTLLRMLGIQTPILAQYSEHDAAVAFHLLVEESRAMGIEVGRDQVLEMLRQNRVRDEQIEAVRHSSGRSLDSILASVGHYQGVIHAAAIGLAGCAPTTPRLEQEFQRTQQRADVRLSVLLSKAFEPSVPPASEAELAAFFEQAKDREPQHTEDSLEFGYQLPIRVRVEYLTVDPSKITAKVTVSEREARKFFSENRSRYFVTPPGSPPPADLEFDKLPDLVRERIRDECRDEKAVAVAQRLMNAVELDARRPWQDRPVGPDGFREPPPDDLAQSFAELAAKHSNEFPVERVTTDLIDLPTLRADPVIGAARLSVGRVQAGIAQLAARVRGIYTPQDNEPIPVLNLMEPGGIVVRSHPDRSDPRRPPTPYQSFLFRVLEAAPAGPPASIEEVREKVTADLRRSRAHALAGEHAERLAARAKQVGLDAAVAEAGELRALLEAADLAEAPPTPSPEPSPPRQYLAALTPFTPEAPFTRVAQYIPHVEICYNLHREVFSVAEAPLGGAPDERRIARVQNARTFRWIVAEVEGLRPLYRDEFVARVGDLSTAFHRNEARQALEEWFDPDNVKLRTGFREAERERF